MVPEFYISHLEGELLLTRTGIWMHKEVPFSNRKLAELFNRSIVWDADAGAYLLQIGKGKAHFRYEDTVYFVLSLDTDDSPWRYLLSDGSVEAFTPAELAVGNESQLYCLVKGTHRARLSRAAYQQLVPYIMDETAVLVNGKAVPLVKEHT